MEIRKIKPGFIPTKVNINSTENYRQFLKRRPKILKEVKIEKTCIANGRYSIRESKIMMKILSRIFKAIKYARKLDLRKLELSFGRHPVLIPLTLLKEVNMLRLCFLRIRNCRCLISKELVSHGSNIQRE